jgi:hypothetical protein
VVSSSIWLVILVFNLLTLTFCFIIHFTYRSQGNHLNVSRSHSACLKTFSDFPLHFNKIITSSLGYCAPVASAYLCIFITHTCLCSTASTAPATFLFLKCSELILSYYLCTWLLCSWLLSWSTSFHLSCPYSNITFSGVSSRPSHSTQDYHFQWLTFKSSCLFPFQHLFQLEILISFVYLTFKMNFVSCKYACTV